MRNLEVRIYPYPDLDKNAMTAPPPASEWISAAQQSLPSLFGLANGFSVAVVVKPGFLSGRRSQALTLAQLRLDLEALVAADPAPGNAWVTRVLVATSCERGLDVYGAMADTGSHTSPRPCRRGCAAFVKAVEDFRINDEDLSSLRRALFVRTVAHEIGHTLNLCHDDSKVASVMSEGLPDKNDLAAMALGPVESRHLANHAEDGVRPGSSTAYGFCPVPSDHPSCRAESEVLSGVRGKSKLQLDLQVHPGTVYPETTVATLVVGEPLCITATLSNRSKRAVSLPTSPVRLGEKLRVGLLVADELDLLTPPAAICDGRGNQDHLLPPGGRLEVSRVVTFARGGVALPRAGEFWVAVSLSVGNRIVRADPVAIHVAPPLLTRHERYCELATTEMSTQDIELGGSSLLGDPSSAPRKLLAEAPDFPLCDHIRIAAGRVALSGGIAPFPAWRASLARVARNSRQPSFVRAQARSLLAQGSRHSSDSTRYAWKEEV